MTATLPREQTQALLTRPHEVAVAPAAVPEPGPLQVLVEVAAVGICGSDVHYYDHGRIADFVVREPLVLGHEASGTIRAVGAEVTDRTPGQRVALEPQETCGRCRECLAGRYNLCPQVRFFATPPIHGAFAQYVVLDAIRAHPVPDELSDEAAALIEPLSVAVWAAQKAGIKPGDRVLVTGAGPVGLLCADVARARGAAWVGVSDTNDHRLAVAADRGASQTVNVAGRAAGRPDRSGRRDSGVQRRDPGGPGAPSPSPRRPRGSSWWGLVHPRSSCRWRPSRSRS